LSNGLKIQWGYKSYSDKTVKLFIGYSNTNYIISVTGYYPASTNAGMIVDNTKTTGTAFTVYATAYSNGGYYWQTIGY
jgi:hypothetical protein